MNRASGKHIIPLLLIAVQVGMLILFAFTRYADPDEGFYLSAAREVANGKQLYSDFFYPQMPYLPHMLSPFAGHGFLTFYLSRMVSVAAAVFTTLLFYLLLLRLTEDRRAINALMLLYVFSGLVLTWHSVAKTYAVTDFLMMAAMYLVIKFRDTEKSLYPLMCGLAMAIAVNVRLVLAPLALVFLIAVAVLARQSRMRHTISYIVAFVAGSIPAVVQFIHDPGRFYFDNLGFHLIRNPGVSFPETIFDRLFTIGKLLINPQIIVVLALAIAAFLAWRRREAVRALNLFSSPTGLCAIVAVVLIAVYLVPNPIMQQYFVQALPFALLASATGLGYFLSNAGSKKSWLFGRKAATVLLAIYVLGSIPYFAVFIGAARERDRYLTLHNLQNVCASLDSRDNEPVAAELPLFSVLCDKPAIPGFEFLGFEYHLPLSPQEMKHYHLILDDQLKEVLDTGQAAYYIVVNDPPEELQASTAANYDLTGTFDRMKVYRRKS
jgi:4-amino-4-deoxy-L-arabinose transferase-like glycosyltransferase